MKTKISVVVSLLAALLMNAQVLQPSDTHQTGTFTIFDVPDATDTFPSSISSSGAVAGFFWYGGGTSATGFVRVGDGSIFKFSAGRQGTYKFHQCGRNDRRMVRWLRNSSWLCAHCRWL
jgi:hypothetical protein